jgi:hypothetical protein
MKKVSMQDIANKLGVSKGTALVPYIHQPLLELLKESKDNNAITVVNTVYDFLREKKNPNNAWSYGEYMIGTTLFYKIEFKHTLNGSPKTLTIESRNRSRENIYVQSLLLNGKPYNSCHLEHRDIFSDDCSLVFTMGSTPNKNWGTDINISDSDN